MGSNLHTPDAPLSLFEGEKDDVLLLLVVLVAVVPSAPVCGGDVACGETDGEEEEA